MKEYDAYMRKLHHVILPEAEITFADWVEIFEALIFKMQQSEALDAEVTRATNSIIQCIAKGVACSEEVLLQLAEVFSCICSTNILTLIKEGKGCTSLKNLHLALKIKLSEVPYTQQALLGQGFTTTLPSSDGIYLTACDETDFEPYFCIVQGGSIYDDEGTFSLNDYNLTQTVFKEL